MLTKILRGILAWIDDDERPAAVEEPERPARYGTIEEVCAALESGDLPNGSIIILDKPIDTVWTCDETLN